MSSMSIYVLTIFHYTRIICEAYNYCLSGIEEKLCTNVTASLHIMCHENVLEKQAELIAVLPMSARFKKIIMDQHNECRNVLAAGNATNEAGMFFPIASRLREFLWDRELAHIANLHASYCNGQHDGCRNTERFRNSGQNLGCAAYTDPQNVTKTLVDISQKMCDERFLILNANDFPDNYPKGVKTQAAFSLIANDRVSRVGCGFAYCQNCEKNHCYYLTCNYDFGIPKDNQVYETALKEPASRCSDWKAIKSAQYENLCTNDANVYMYD